MDEYHLVETEDGKWKVYHQQKGVLVWVDTVSSLNSVVDTIVTHRRIGK